MSTPTEPTQFQSPFTKLSLYFHSIASYYIRHRRTFLTTLASSMLVLILFLVWMGYSSKHTVDNTLKANALVQQLTSPVLGEKQPPTPAYSDIQETLTSSRALQERYNGVLLEESLIQEPNNKKEVFSRFQKMARLTPTNEWPWEDIAPITELLETEQYEPALASIERLLTTIEKKQKESMYLELVGYLRVMEGYCLQELKKPESDSSVQFENWKQRYPAAAKQLSSLITLEK